LSHRADSLQGFTTVYDKRQQPLLLAAMVTPCRKATTIDYCLPPFTVSEIHD